MPQRQGKLCSSRIGLRMLEAGLPCIIRAGKARTILVVPCCLCYCNELKPLQPGELCRMNLQCSGNTHLRQPVISDLQIASAHLLSSELKSAIHTSDDFPRYSWRAKELNWTLQRKWFLIPTQNCAGCPCGCTSHHQILTNSNSFWLTTSRWVIRQRSSVCVTETYILWVPAALFILKDLSPLDRLQICSFFRICEKQNISSFCSSLCLVSSLSLDCRAHSNDPPFLSCSLLWWHGIPAFRS